MIPESESSNREQPASEGSRKQDSIACESNVEDDTQSVCSDQIGNQEISVVVPLEERSSRYTNRQHHILAGGQHVTLSTLKE